MHIAILDLGTNTFHLLLAEVQKSKIKYVYRDEQWAYLAEGGIEEISISALARARNILTQYKNVIETYRCEMIVATGTAAFRKAKNANELHILVSEIIGVDVSVLNGDDEARLIYEGVCKALQHSGTHELLLQQPFLMVDIGGGSTEFVISNKKEILFKKSYPIGATVLKQKFQRSEPIANDELLNLKNYVKNELDEVFALCKTYEVKAMVGASGSFDSFANMLLSNDYVRYAPVHVLNKQKLLQKFQLLYSMNLEERRHVPGLLWFRAEMMVAAALLTETILQGISIDTIIQSGYSLKEGVMAELVSAG